MNLSTTYAKLKSKLAEKPWYTKWIWWVLAGSVGIIVFALWSVAKKREARAKAALEIAETKADQARLMALAEKDKEKAAKLLTHATQADKKAREMKVQMEASAASRKELEAAIKGATTWDELDAIEETVE